ncbi:hypothetical protein HanXRQr2_Chr02g0066441 [Helianthus annuus]|uniref:Uncharacterized protein n=1 Tax=Helianthus annuus TaxID=4232 RepID=A0A251VF97_HELAN|nr:hypothetical protein HanXRQr2_Chr02g0066441 [Helianthus annuus]KAJ0951860.1 hypothetical protein HanPSC8_Chr02g0065351 [Helianthus annuus]
MITFTISSINLQESRQHFKNHTTLSLSKAFSRISPSYLHIFESFDDSCKNQLKSKVFPSYFEDPNVFSRYLSLASGIMAYLVFVDACFVT